MYLADIIVLLPSQRLTGPDPHPRKIDVLLPEFRKKKSFSRGSWWWVFNLDSTFFLFLPFTYLILNLPLIGEPGSKHIDYETLFVRVPNVFSLQKSSSYRSVEYWESVWARLRHLIIYDLWGSVKRDSHKHTVCPLSSHVGPFQPDRNKRHAERVALYDEKGSLTQGSRQELPLNKEVDK